MVLNFHNKAFWIQNYFSNSRLMFKPLSIKIEKKSIPTAIEIKNRTIVTLFIAFI